jgi:hypothetical protein
MVDRQRREQRLDATRSTEEMAGHRLGGIDHQLACVSAESALDGNGFRLVAQGRRSTMCIDVLHILRIQLCVTQGIAHATRRPLTVVARCGDVVGVGTHTETRQLAIDARAACLGMFVFFQHHDAGALH